MAANVIRARGLDKALFRLNRQIKNMPTVTLKGQVQAGFKIQGDAQRLTPVDTSNLRNSAYTIWPRKKTGDVPKFTGKDAGERQREHDQVIKKERGELSKDRKKPSVEVGFTAAYALPVHENLEAKHPVGQAKYLEASVVSNLDDIIKILKANVVTGIDRNPKAPS